MNFSLHLNPDTFSALRSRNFKIFLAGQAVALTGLWMQRLANSWLVYRVTSSAFKLGLIELMANAPIFVLGLIAGAWLDKHDIRKTMIATQTLTMLHAVVMAIIVLSGSAQFWNILILSFYLGLVNAVDLPARQSSIMLMVENKAQLKSALALHSMVFNLSRLIGPSLAGFIIAFTGEGLCFVITAVCYIPVIMALYIIRFRERIIVKSKKNNLSETVDGIKYVAGTFQLRTLLLFLSIFATFSYSYIVLFPIFAKDILGGGSQLLGFLLGGIGFGAIFGAFSLASFVKIQNLPKTIAIASLIHVIFISLFAISPSPLLSVLLAIPAGFGLVATFVASNTLLQISADEDKRGRVISLYTICVVGLGPIGAFIAGTLAEWTNAPKTMLIAAFVMLVANIFLWLKMKKLNASLEPVLKDY